MPVLVPIPQPTVFGRLYAPDPKDIAYKIESPSALRMYLRPSQMWTAGPITNQGRFPHCVGHAWRQMLEASPVRRGQRTLPSPEDIYRRAQRVDEWPGEDYDGTSVRAGAKVLQEMGLIKEYRWASDIETARRYVLSRGPLVVGTEWYEGMSLPAFSKGDAYLTPVGENMGGHAYVIIGYSHSRRAFRMINSWGTRWGENGRAWIDYDVMNELLFHMNGEACSAVEFDTLL